MKQPAKKLTERKLLKLYPNAKRFHLELDDSDGQMFRIDDFTVVELSTTHLYQCEVFAAGLNHSINISNSLGFQFHLQDLPKLQKICRELSDLIHRGARCKYMPKRYTAKERAELRERSKRRVERARRKG